MKTLKQFFVLILVALVAIALFACKEDDPPEPTAQSISIVVNGTGGNSVTVIIKYMALPNTTPSYMPKLKQALSWIDEYQNFGNRTGTVYINIISGNTAPVKNGSKTLDVGNEWLSAKSDEDIYDALTVTPTFINSWFE